MTVDLACAAPAFLDLTFAGLAALPGPGEEAFAADLLRSPGGGAITAIGAARLGLSVALVSPLGEDEAGEFVRAALEAEGVAVTPTRVPRTPVTAVLPVRGDRAMATFAPPVAARAQDLERLAPRAVVCGPETLAHVPPESRAYLTLGDEEARTLAGRLPEGADALLLNEREALRLTGAASARAASTALAHLAPAVVITRGAVGALCVVDERTYEATAPAVPVVDTTGAGDLFAAAWAWGEELEPERRLAWATLYAGLSVRRATGAGGAVRRQELLEEGARRGLPVPVAPQTITKEPSA